MSGKTIILRNEKILTPQKVDLSSRRRMTSSMFFLDEEPAFTDSESESEFDTEIPGNTKNDTTVVKTTMPIAINSSSSIKIINSDPKKQVSDAQVQCDILTKECDLKGLIEICANLEATGEYDELIQLCKKLSNRNDDKYVNRNKPKEKESIILTPSRFGETLSQKSSRKAIKRTSVRHSDRIKKSAEKKKSLKTTKIIEEISRKSTKRSDPENLFDSTTVEFFKPKIQVSSSMSKSLARNWMNPNKSFTAPENSRCEQNYLSLQHRKTRRLYSPSQWMDSEELMKYFG
ncbi:uncharacterized protein LOC130892957 [Diorhabda carinulata]|uniref:uncharacterized protein LOC130892957 n=1 Tax=Diorhabda carinulata TaxID=1163345 RepID=UPI0025A003E3|nr:uncharacterized protein LOC130892957 [Diorhabda carinulata]